MKKLLALILALVLCVATVSFASYATDEFLPSPDPITDHDVNNDGIVNILDAIEITKYLVGDDKGFDYYKGDFDENGTVNILDAIVVTRVLIG